MTKMSLRCSLGDRVKTAQLVGLVFWLSTLEQIARIGVMAMGAGKHTQVRGRDGVSDISQRALHFKALGLGLLQSLTHPLEAEIGEIRVQLQLCNPCKAVLLDQDGKFKLLHRSVSQHLK